MASILIVEDDRNLGVSLRTALSNAGHDCRLTMDCESARAACDQDVPDLALVDLRLPDGSGLELMQQIHERGLRFPVIMMTAFGTVTSAVAALKKGAVDYIEKPQSVTDLSRIVNRYLEDRELTRQLEIYEKAQWADPGELELIGECPRMRKVLATADKVASLPIDAGLGLLTTLMSGETGTGKEMVARYIHHRSAQREREFVHVNCTATPESLLEAEYFGHERGIFTDAKTRKEGLLEAADEGTLYLDEIGDMPASMQAKLLVALETGRFRRVGATAEQSVRMRVIAATNSDLDDRTRAGLFRQDLYHRLTMFRIELPPLRERGDDIILLADHFLRQFSAKLGKRTPTLASETVDRLRAHSWPGNVRELAHTLLRALVLCEADRLEPGQLPLTSEETTLSSPSAQLQFDLSRSDCTFEQVERKVLQTALDRCGGSITKAARLLGMTRGTLRYRLERLRMSDVDPGEKSHNTGT